METKQATVRAIIMEKQIQIDKSGVGHSWQDVSRDDLQASIREEIDAWIIEDAPKAGDEYVASNGRKYRIL